MNFGGDHPAHGHGKISPRCVPKLPAMARYRPGAFPRCRPWRDCALMRSRRGLGRGNTGSWQHIAAMCSDTACFGKICVLCVRKAPQSAVGECTARTSCRQGAFSPSEALRSCTAHESCHPPVALPLRRGSCPSSCIAGSPFNGLALAQGCLPQRSADACHLPMPAACRARCGQGQAADELRRRSSGAWPAVRPSPEGPPTASSRWAGRQRSAAQNWAWIPEPRTSGRRTAGGGRRPGRACASAAKNAHRKDESLLAEL